MTGDTRSDAEEKPPAAVDRLVEELRGAVGAEPERFTLAREQARETLREHLLTEPVRYVLLLVQAVLQRGATRLSWRIDADDVELTCDGEPWSAEALEARYDAALGGAKTDRPGLADLVLALRSCLQLRPRWATVRCGDGSVGVELRLEADGSESLSPLKEPVDGIQVHVKLTPGPGRLVDRVTGQLHEVTLLTECCQYASTAVLVNGEDVAHGPRLHGDYVAQMELQVPESIEVTVRGELGYDPAATFDQQLRLVRHGVWVETINPLLPSWRDAQGLVAVAACDALRLDLSRSRVLQDDTHKLVRQAVEATYRRIRTRLKPKSLLARRRRELVAGPLEELAQVARKRGRLRKLVTWISGVVVGLAVLALSVWTDQKGGLLGSTELGFFAILSGAIAITVSGPLVAWLIFGPSPEARVASLYPPGSPLRKAARDLAKRRKSEHAGWQRLYRLLKKAE